MFRRVLSIIVTIALLAGSARAAFKGYCDTEKSKGSCCAESRNSCTQGHEQGAVYKKIDRCACPSMQATDRGHSESIQPSSKFSVQSPDIIITARSGDFQYDSSCPHKILSFTPLFFSSGPDRLSYFQTFLI